MFITWFAVVVWFMLLVISIFWLGRRVPSTNPF
jgi:hypothetical protein